MLDATGNLKAVNKLLAAGRLSQPATYADWDIDQLATCTETTSESLPGVNETL